MISQNTIQQILSRIDIIEIVGSFVKLKKRGANYLGLCPFHNEKTPSFTVSPSKEIYKCFGCGRSGNTIGFLMEHEKYSYVEALRWLAQKYNVEVEETEQSPEMKAQQLLADSLYLVNQFAQKYFSEALFNTEEGVDIGLSYFKERGFREEIIQKFQLGYCPDQRDVFARAAISKGYNTEYLVKTGLVVMRNDRPADNYHGRVIFPVHNQTGKVMGFGARILKTTDRSPKYINTPENEIYIKSRILYGTWFARQAIDRQDECLLVEGYTDVISLHQAGIENVVASGGTSLTTDQLRLIKKYTRNLTILYDGDAAGVKAAIRGLGLAVEEGLNVKLVLIPDKEDPDSYVQKIGATAFRQFIDANRKDFILFQLQLSIGEAGSDPVKKSALVNQLAETIAKIDKTEDFTRQQDYIRQCSELLKIDEQGLTGLVNKYIRERLQKAGSFSKEESSLLERQAAESQDTSTDDAAYLLHRDEMQEKKLVHILLRFGQNPMDEQQTVADYIFQSSIEFDYFENDLAKKIIVEYRNMHEKGQQPESRYFLYHPVMDIARFTAEVLEFYPKETHLNYESWKERFDIDVQFGDRVYRDDVAFSISWLKIHKIQRMLLELNEELSKDAVQENDLSNIRIYNHLKQMQQDILREPGTTIFK